MQNNRRFPDLFIVGAPKSGTSAIHAYLNKHPNIFMSSPKEPNYFCFDLPGVSNITDEETYIELFRNARATDVIGETSPWYLYSERAAHEIATVKPDAKIIALLRNPVDAAYALHGQLRLGFREDQESFRTAWALQEERRKGNQLPSYRPEPAVLQYGNVYKYASQIERYVNIFPRENVKIIIFEDFIKTTKSYLSDIMTFLDLDPVLEESYEPVGESRVYRNNRLLQLVFKPPRMLRPVIFTGKRVLNLFGITPSELAMKKMADKTKRLRLDEDFRAELWNTFEPDIARLETILGRELTAWRQRGEGN